MNCQEANSSIPPSPVKLNSRLNLLAVILLGGAVTATFLIHRAEESERAVLVESAESALRLNTQHWLDLADDGMSKFVEDYSWWDEMVAFIAEPDPSWAEENFDGALELWEISGLWLVDPSAQLVYQLTSRTPGGIEFPLSREELWETCRATPFPHFYKPTPHGLLELRGAPIQPGDDDERSSPARGWMLVGRMWDEPFLGSLVPPGDEVRLRIIAATEAAAKEEDPDTLRSRIALPDEQGEIVAYLDIQQDQHHILQWQDSGIDETILMLGFAFGSVIVLLIWLGTWVVRPVRSIDRALRQGSAEPIGNLAASSGEFGEIARLIADSFDQAAQLRSETEQRRETEAALRESEETLRQTLRESARLGLNLHDSTIQTLYASGMNLVAVENRSPDLPAKDRDAIKEVRKNLQATIDELRWFIGQTETSIAANSVSESINAMLAFLRNTSQVQINTEIDEIPNDLLSPAKSIHLLQILREAVTNALRHAQADVITVTVQVRSHLLRLRVEDDGVGLPEHTPEAVSRGLLNIHQRAQIAAADLKIDSRPGGGTRIDLDFHTR